MNIIISPFSKSLRNGERNPKNYPYWDELVSLLKSDGHVITQLMYASEITLPGVSNTIIYTSLKDMETTISKFDLFISVDNFVPHLAYTIKKRGIVLWGKSDPTIFGYSENVNLLKDKKYLRARQFDIWESEKYDQSVFILPQKVMEEVKKWKV